MLINSFGLRTHLLRQDIVAGTDAILDSRTLKFPSFGDVVSTWSQSVPWLYHLGALKENLLGRRHQNKLPPNGMFQQKSNPDNP